MSGMDMNVNSLRGDNDGKYSGPYNPHNPTNRVWIFRWPILRAISLALFWTVVPAVVLGVTGAGVLTWLLAVCNALVGDEFTYFCYGISALWLSFSVLDGVPFRIFDRFMRCEGHLLAAIDGWFATDNKLVGWGPRWWNVPGGAAQWWQQKQYWDK